MSPAGTRQADNPLPREIAPGVFWLGQCLELSYRSEILHMYNSVFLVVGEECSALVESGHPQDLQVLEEQLEQLMATGLPELRYLFVTHSETPHASGVGRLLHRYPELEAVGGVLDLHLIFPEVADRIRILNPGDSLDLGGTELKVVESVFRDLPYTRWAFDTKRRVLFPGDGFSYAHYHAVDHCGALAEDAEELAVSDMTALFADLAFDFTRHIDLDPYVERIGSMILDELDAQVVAPTHGLPIGKVRTMLPKVFAGLQLGGSRESGGQVI